MAAAPWSFGGGLARPRGSRAALAAQGIETTVVHLMPTLMERHLDANAAIFAEGGSRSAASRFSPRRTPTPFLATVRSPPAVAARGGRTLPADLVVMAVGIRPTPLAKEAGLEVRRAWWSTTNLRTSDADIFRRR